MRYKASDAATCWPEGDYEAVIKGVEATTSKRSGAEMEVISFEVYDANGRTQTVKDYIVGPSANGSGTIFKLKRIAKALGKEADFKAETFQVSDHLNAGLILTLGVEESIEYDDKNKVDGYKPLVRQSGAAPAATPAKKFPAKHEPLTEDDIPF